MLHAGLFDDQPRAREIVWIMLAQRAARGLASLYAQANLFDLQQAKAFQVKWTPRGWMRPDLDLLGFEQQLYLRQPGYGTSYVTGKHLLEDLMRVRADQLGKGFTVKRFFDEVNGAGMIPVSLIRWQLTGSRREDVLRRPRPCRLLRRAGRHGRSLHRPACRREVRRADHRDPGRPAHARQLLATATTAAGRTSRRT